MTVSVGLRCLVVKFGQFQDSQGDGVLADAAVPGLLGESRSKGLAAGLPGSQVTACAAQCGHGQGPVWWLLRSRSQEREDRLAALILSSSR